MHDLVHPLVGDAKLPRQLCLRDASGVAGAVVGIAFLDAERLVRPQAFVVELGEGGGDGNPPIL